MNLTQSQIHELIGGASSEKIEQLESFMIGEAQIEIPVKEDSINGLYTREIVIPKDTLLTGRVHKHPYVDIMLSGDITVATPDGVKRLTGANVCDGQPGRKRAGYAHEDTRWVTVHRTDQVDEVIEHITFFSMKEYKDWTDRQDFLLVAEKSGFSIEEIREQSENESDRVDIVLSNMEIKESSIQGLGLFSTVGIPPYVIICPSRIDGKRTQAGRYINHSTFPNCQMVVDPNGDIFVRTIERVRADEELTVNYSQVLMSQGLLEESA